MAPMPSTWAAPFGARSAAGNSIEDIEALARHAHRFGAQVFVAFNTLLHDHELEQARRLTHQIYEAGVDALIVQDMGLLALDLPPSRCTPVPRPTTAPRRR